MATKFLAVLLLTLVCLSSVSGDEDGTEVVPKPKPYDPVEGEPETGGVIPGEPVVSVPAPAPEPEILKPEPAPEPDIPKPDPVPEAVVPKPEPEIVEPVPDPLVPGPLPVPEPETEPAVPDESENLPTGPSILDEIPEESTSAYTFDAQCSCFVRTFAKMRSSDLLAEELAESPKAENCDKAGMDECIQFCNRRINEVTNGFDLEKVPITRTNVDVSLGQYICNQIGSHILPARMKVYAKLTCKTSSPGRESLTSHLATTGVYSKQNLWCVKGKFRQFVTESRISSAGSLF